MGEFHKISRLWSAKQFCHKNLIKHRSSEVNRTSAHAKFPRKIGYINKIFFVVRLYWYQKHIQAEQYFTELQRNDNSYLCRLISSRFNPFFILIIPVQR